MASARTRSGTVTLWFGLVGFAVLQAWFVHDKTDGIRPGIEEMPPPPDGTALKALAFGDEEFLFRYLSRWLQNVGDGGGRVRPLRDYDYDLIVGWLETLDSFDAYKSDYVHELAARYFGEVNIDPGRVRKIVQYLRLVGIRDPAHNWKWLVWSAHTARSLKDVDLLKGIARDLQSPELVNPDVPAWVRVLPVRLYHLADDDDDARDALAKTDPKDIESIARARKALDDAVRRGGRKAGSGEESGIQ